MKQGKCIHVEGGGLWENKKTIILKTWGCAYVSFGVVFQFNSQSRDGKFCRRLGYPGRDGWWWKIMWPGVVIWYDHISFWGVFYDIMWPGVVYISLGYTYILRPAAATPFVFFCGGTQKAVWQWLCELIVLYYNLISLTSVMVWTASVRYNLIF